MAESSSLTLVKPHLLRWGLPLYGFSHVGKVETRIKRENGIGGRTGAKQRMHHNGENPGWESRNKMYLDPIQSVS